MSQRQFQSFSSSDEDGHRKDLFSKDLLSESRRMSSQEVPGDLKSTKKINPNESEKLNKKPEDSAESHPSYRTMEGNDFWSFQSRDKGGRSGCFCLKVLFISMLFLGCLAAAFLFGRWTNEPAIPPVADLSRFGHGLRDSFIFDQTYTLLNHGSYGTLPAVVHRAQTKWQQTMEQNTDLWFRFEQQQETEKVKARLAEYINAKPDDVVFVDNASSGVNAVLRSLFPPRDAAARLSQDLLVNGTRILYLDTAYFMVKNTLQYIEQVHGWQLEEVAVDWDGGSKGIVDNVRSALEANPGDFGLCAFSHIVSVPAAVLPLAELVPLCRKHGAKILIDGAHALGHVPLNVPALNVDFYLSNGHKWLYSPKASAFLWVTPQMQDSVFPIIISGGPGNTIFLRKFSWQGTNDYSPYLAMATALDFREGLPSGEDGVMEYLHNLARKGGEEVASAWGTDTLLANEPAMQSAMVNVRLPLHPLPKNYTAGELANQLFETSKTYVPVFPISITVNGSRDEWWYCRISAQIYNDATDFTFYARAMKSILDSKPWESH